VEPFCPTTLTCADSLAAPSVDAEGRSAWSDRVADACGRETPDGVRKASDPLEVGVASGLNTIRDEYDLDKIKHVSITSMR
jgi:hypothetical protein